MFACSAAMAGFMAGGSGWPFKTSINARYLATSAEISSADLGVGAAAEIGAGTRFQPHHLHCFATCSCGAEHSVHCHAVAAGTASPASWSVSISVLAFTHASAGFALA